MNKRKLKRQLNLVQVVMLGTAGAIGAQIFVLTGHAAGMIGPAFVLAIILGGVLSYSIALNYGELASSFPETGGAMTYVREAWGPNLLTFLVGSLDCLSSTFYAALSAIGFAYSLQIFFPAMPIVPTAIGIILVFVVLNILGVGNIGNIQILLGGTLLFVLLAYIVLGLSLPGGFQWSTFLSGGKFFIYDGGWENFYRLLSTIALAYVAYIGFEVIADDAEEIKNPDRAIPLGILVSLTLLLIIYPMIILVTLGTVSWQELAGSETALTDAVVRFLPQWGPAALGVTGIIATITSLNAAMLSATREAFTLSRDGMWPRFLSRLGRFRTPYAATLVIGLIIIAVASVGLVEFLSYISSSGYLFVLFWSNLTLIRLRKRYPNLHRPFKVPSYPITVYLAIGTCLLIISFTDLRALGFGAGLLGVLTVAYYLSPVVNQIYITHISSVEKNKDRILVPIANPKSGAHLVRMATILARASEDTGICIFNVQNSGPAGEQLSNQRAAPQYTKIPADLMREAQKRNVPIYTKSRMADNISLGILDEIEDHHNIKFILMGWPGPLNANTARNNPVKVLLEKAKTNMAVLLSRNPGKIRHILVPIGGGSHSRLALRVAYEIATQENAYITALHIYSKTTEADDIEDELNFLREIVVDELGLIPACLIPCISRAEQVTRGVLQETKRQPYDLLVMGASEEYGSGTRLFGSVDDWIIQHIEHCSVLLIRHHELTPVHWLRRQFKMMGKS
jgi:amino acid transporter/nucleotide-binding universal stress UspA family protein